MSSGRGVGGTELFGAVVTDQVLRVGEAAIPLHRLVVIGDVEGRGILVGMDVLRGTILTVSGDPVAPGLLAGAARPYRFGTECARIEPACV